MSEAKVPSAVCENDECDVYRSLPEVTHRIFGVTSPSYHDLAHLYAAQAAEIARLREALTEIAKGEPIHSWEYSRIARAALREGKS